MIFCSYCDDQGCLACDPAPDEALVKAESSLQQAQRKKREEDALRAAGMPTLRGPQMQFALQRALRRK